MTKIEKIDKLSAQYPKRLIDVLGHEAPDKLYVNGSVGVLNLGGVAIVGPRCADRKALQFCLKAGIATALIGKQVISGDAKGCDSSAMDGSCGAGVGGIAVLPYCVSYKSEDMMITYISICPPADRFSVSNAVNRNKVIYALSDMALVADCQKGKGGTWRGASECLNKYKSIPLYVDNREGSPGITDLIARGARPYASGDIERFYGFENANIL